MKFDIQLNGAIDYRYPDHTGTNFIIIDTWTSLHVSVLIRRLILARGFHFDIQHECIEL